MTELDLLNRDKCAVAVAHLWEGPTSRRPSWPVTSLTTFSAGCLQANSHRQGNASPPTPKQTVNKNLDSTVAKKRGNFRLAGMLGRNTHTKRDRCAQTGGKFTQRQEEGGWSQRTWPAKM